MTLPELVKEYNRLLYYTGYSAWLVMGTSGFIEMTRACYIAGEDVQYTYTRFESLEEAYKVISRDISLLKKYDKAGQ